jgi:uncharacterized protein YbjT (DUF2867 family)
VPDHRPHDDAPVLVTGATGTVGRAVVEGLSTAGVPVRAARSRDLDATGATPSAQGVSGQLATVGFDFTDATTWPAAYDGVRQMFLMRPPHLGRPRTQMLPAMEAARAAGVRQVVLLSLQGAEHNRVVPHATLERWLRESGMDWTFVRPSFFMQNLTTTHVSDIRDRDELVVPAGRGATAFVDAADVAAVAVAALLAPGDHRGRAWTPTGPEALTYGEVAETLSTVLGRRITYRDPSMVRYAAHARSALGMPWGMVAVTTAIYTTARLGRAASLTDDVQTVTGGRPRSFEEFAVHHAEAWQALD